MVYRSFLDVMYNDILVTSLIGQTNVFEESLLTHCNVTVVRIFISGLLYICTYDIQC